VDWAALGLAYVDGALFGTDRIFNWFTACSSAFRVPLSSGFFWSFFSAPSATVMGFVAFPHYLWYNRY
jgi:hypothetical protein